MPGRRVVPRERRVVRPAGRAEPAGTAPSVARPGAEGRGRQEAPRVEVEAPKAAAVARAATRLRAGRAAREARQAPAGREVPARAVAASLLFTEARRSTPVPAGVARCPSTGQHRR